MKVFLSWSKELSLEVAKSFGEWLPTVIQECSEPFISVDIDKGEPWFEMIRSNLADTDIGLVFITPENTNETWLNFEAGAMLNKFGKSGVCPILVGLKKSDYTGPMKQLQLTEIDSEVDVRGLLATINKKCSAPLPQPLLEKVVDKFWPELQESIQESVKKSRGTKPAPAVRSLDDKVDEILNLTRSIANAESEPWSVWKHAFDVASPEPSNRSIYQALLASLVPRSTERYFDELRMHESDSHHETRMERFEKEFGSRTAIRKSDSASGMIVDFAKKDGKLYWVGFRDNEGNVQRCTPDEIEIYRPQE
jgi:hypothetical protein